MNVKMSFSPLKQYENIEFEFDLELNLKDILEKRQICASMTTSSRQ